MSCPRNIIGIHGAPRSGTSWLGQIFNSSPLVAFRFQPLFSHSLKGYINERSNGQEILEFYQKTFDTKDQFILQKDPSIHKNYPSFEKSRIHEYLVFKHVRFHHVLTNLLSKSNLKLIMVIRHPCAVINSWIKAPKEFLPEWDPAKEWYTAESKNRGRVEEYYGYEKWKELTVLFINLKKRYPERTYLLKYQDLITNTTQQVTDLFNFCNIPIGRQTYQFLQKSTSGHTEHPYGVYRSKIHDDDWKTSLPVYIQNEILEDLHKSQIHSLFNEKGI